MISISNLDELKALLSALPAQNFSEDDTSQIRSLLESCWDEFEGSQNTRMRDYKVSRMEELVWNPPVLTFITERHGGAALGSIYAELQEWNVDIDKETAHCAGGRKRLISPRAEALWPGPIVAELYKAIQEGYVVGPPGSVTRHSENEVTIKPSAFAPAGNSPRRTVEGRRRNMRSHVIKMMQSAGWFPIERKGPMLRFKKDGSV